jgi:hypothetical protein
MKRKMFAVLALSIIAFGTIANAQTPSIDLDPKTEAYYNDLVAAAPQFGGKWMTKDTETEKLAIQFCKVTLSTKENPVPLENLARKYEAFADQTLPLFKSKTENNELKPLFISYLSRQSMATYCPQQLGELNKLLVYNALI